DRCDARRPRPRGAVRDGGVRREAAPALRGVPGRVGRGAAGAGGGHLLSEVAAMKRALLGVAVSGLAALALLPGCSRGELSGPPELRVGRDECGECGVIISEDRCSSAILVERGGRREHVLFDDIGCMLDYERGRAGEFAAVDAFVHDHPTRAWVRAADAHFLFADRDLLPTPMGSGIVAYAERAA